MRSVYIAANLPEAELVRHRLMEKGIESVVRNTYLQGALGELPVNLNPEVCVVEDKLFEDARAIVHEIEARNAAPSPPDVNCPHCSEENPGNFEICWKCRHDLGSGEAR